MALNLAPAGLVKEWLAAVPLLDERGIFAAVAGAARRDHVRGFIVAAIRERQDVIDRQGVGPAAICTGITE
jgi:hypothetical protein